MFTNTGAKKIKRIVFLEPNSGHINVYSDVPIPRLGVILLATISRQLGYEVEVFIEDIKPIEPSIVLEADLVCISAITSTAPQAYDWADFCQAANIPVLLGGIHPSFLSEEALTHAPLVLRGEADESFVNLLNCMQVNDDFGKIAGLSWRDQDGAYIHNSNAPLPSSEVLSNLPFPDFSLVHGYGEKQPAAVSIAGVRGCPFDCSFCSVTTFNGKKFRSPSVDWIISAIRHYTKLYGGICYLFFTDDTFNIMPKRMRELLHQMITEDLTPSWGAQCRHEIAKHPKDLELMKKAGCDRLFIGFESPIQATLDDYGKKQTVDNIITTVQACHNAGISVHGMFVPGSDKDPSDIAERTVHFVEENEFDSIQLMMLTPLPGSRDWQRFAQGQAGLLTRVWSMFDGHHPVHSPVSMSPLHLYNTVAVGMRKFYRPDKIRQALFRFFRTRQKNDWRTVLLVCSGWWLTRKWEWQKINRLYGKFLKGHPEKTGQSFEQWQVEKEKKKKLVIACPAVDQLRKRIPVFLNELDVEKITLINVARYRINTVWYQGSLIAAWKDKREEAKSRFFHWLQSFGKDVHFVLPTIDFSSVNREIREMGESVSHQWAKIKNCPRVIHLPTEVDDEAIRSALYRLGSFLGADKLKIQSAIIKAMSASVES